VDIPDPNGSNNRRRQRKTNIGDGRRRMQETYVLYCFLAFIFKAAIHMYGKNFLDCYESDFSYIPTCFFVAYRKAIIQVIAAL
jgi:hypothetical protein